MERQEAVVASQRQSRERMTAQTVAAHHLNQDITDWWSFLWSELYELTLLGTLWIQYCSCYFGFCALEGRAHDHQHQQRRVPECTKELSEETLNCLQQKKKKKNVLTDCFVFLCTVNVYGLWAPLCIIMWLVNSLSTILNQVSLSVSWWHMESWRIKT